MPPRSAPRADPSAAPGWRGPRLRPATAGYDIAQWPLRVPPHDDELPQSWLARVAWRYGLAPTALLRILDPRIVRFSVRDFSRLLDDLAIVTRTRAPRRLGTVESQIARWSFAYERRHATGAGSSFCPACLAEPEPYWRQSWAHPLSIVCFAHGRLLVDRCPGCGKRPYATLFAGQRPAPPWLCPSRREDDDRVHRTRREWCGTDLRKVESARVASEELAAVAHVESAIDLAARRGSDRWDLAPQGWQTTHVEYLDALFELIDEQVPARTWPVVDREALLAAVRVAVSLVQSTAASEVAELCDRHGVMNPVGNHTPLHPSRHRHARNRLLLALRLQSLEPGLSLASRLEFRLASAMPRAPLDDEKRVDGRVRPTGRWPAHGWVPPTMWPGVLDHVGLTSRPHARAALSLALSKVGSNAPLRAIAVSLGFPGWIADHVARVFVGTDLRAVSDALEDLFSRLEANPPPIDYAQRVNIGHERAPFDAAVEKALLAQDLEIDTSARNAAAAQLWAAYTGSSTAYCPWVPQPTELLIPWFVDRTDLLAQAYVALPHRPREPLAWAPP